jgi:hypothetical protein
MSAKVLPINISTVRSLEAGLKSYENNLNELLEVERAIRRRKAQIQGKIALCKALINQEAK